MKRRCCILILMALGAGASGCAGTARRDDGSTIFGPRAWNQPPTPPQGPVSLTAAGSDKVANPEARPSGLARYFPGLVRKSADAPKLAERSRPTWFSPRSPQAIGTKTYVTDAREQLDRRGPEPTSLAVALQVPTERASSDNLVTPANAEEAEDRRPTPPIDPRVTQSSAATLDFGGKPTRPGEDEVNPLPPASEPEKPAQVVNRMPELPAVDPLEDPKPANPGPDPAPADDRAPDNQAVKASTDASESSPPAEPSKATKPTTQVTETSKTSPAPAPSPVLASPQGPPPHVHPTSQARPTPQAGVATTGESKTWKRPCLRRLVRKLCNLGEYATPPTAAPH